MRQLTEPYDLKAWRRRMGWRQRDAALALGLSIDGYRRAEYRAEDRAGAPVARTLAILARMLEAEVVQRAVLKRLESLGEDVGCG